MASWAQAPARVLEQYLLVEAGNAEALFWGLRLRGTVAGSGAGFVLLEDGVNEGGGRQGGFNSRRVPRAGLLYLGAGGGTGGLFFDTNHRAAPWRNRKRMVTKVAMVCQSLLSVWHAEESQGQTLPPSESWSLKQD